MSEIPIARLPAHWAETLGDEAIALVHDDEHLTWAETGRRLEPAGPRLPQARRAGGTTT